MILTTPEQARDYFEWHVQNGRGQDKLVVDQRGLYEVHAHNKQIELASPPDGETHAAGKVYFRLVF